MKVRAIKDLTQLNDQAFFAAIAEGLQSVMANVNRLRAGSEALSEAGQFQNARVLMTIAGEEASKYLILLDAVRCTRQPSDRLARQLGRFHDHLAKGIYSRACAMFPNTLARLQEYVEHERKDFYVDGDGNGLEWIVYNDILFDRENNLYVDYLARGDDHWWSDPASYDAVLQFAPGDSPSIVMARSLHQLGFSQAATLATVAS